MPARPTPPVEVTPKVAALVTKALALEERAKDYEAKALALREERRRIVCALRDRGVPTNQVAELLGISAHAVRQIRHKAAKS